MACLIINVQESENIHDINSVDVLLSRVYNLLSAQVRKLQHC